VPPTTLHAASGVEVWVMALADIHPVSHTAGGTLSWGRKEIAARLLDLALDADHRDRAG
jgi:hypothetical protein